ncbi:MAG: hypothetical protein HC884_10175 [Chloroflexaceae bacterium]|nr:hypothetical protein [Chloroflexaceae bacterium]
MLDETGQYRAVLPTAEGIYHSTMLPGFWLRLAWLWEAHPDLLATLAEVVGTEPLIAALRGATQAADTEETR